MGRRQQYLFVGVDLHKDNHVAVLVNHWGEKIIDIKFENKPSAFPALLTEIFKHKKKPLKLAFGLEDVGGYGRRLALFLIEQKQIVKEVNSALSSSQRKSFPTTKKDDYWDAYCCALVLMQRFDTLPDTNPQDIYFNIGQLVGRRIALVNTGVRLKNQLHQQLFYHYPSYIKFFSEIDGKCSLNFFEKYPSPSKLKDIPVDKLGEELREWSHFGLGIKKATEIKEFVSKDGDTTREYQEYRDFLIESVVKEIKYKEEEVIKIDKQLESLMDKLDYKLTSMQGIDVATACTIISEIGDINRFSSSDKLARFCGTAPITFGSGNSSKVCISKQGNRRLNSVLYFLAVRQLSITRNTKEPYNAYYYEYFQKKLKEGKSKQSAVMCIMRKLINVIYAMMKDKSEYKKPTVKVTMASVDINTVASIEDI